MGHLNLETMHGNVAWIGIGGLRWAGLLPLLRRKLQVWAPPHILVIHLGSNDLVGNRTVDLGYNILNDLHAVAALIPQVKLIWSYMLPRRVWRGANSHKAMEKNRRRINRKAVDVVTSLGGGFIKHDIDDRDPGLYREDDVHLSDIGNAIFVNEIQEALFQTIAHLN